MNLPQLEADTKGDARYYHRPWNFSFVWNWQHRPRRRMFELFMDAFHPVASDRVLDLGSTNLPEPLENFFEVYYPYKQRITTAGIEDCAFLETRYPGLTFTRLAPGKPLPFDSDVFNLGFSNATIEHVGSRAQQAQFIREMLRVCRKVFITTPNRWYPFELHTRLPFVHWLPARMFRALLVKAGYPFYATEENLNLLSAHDLRSLVPAGPWSVRLKRNYFLGFPSNLLLIIEKTQLPS